MDTLEEHPGTSTTAQVDNPSSSDLDVSDLVDFNFSRIDSPIFMDCISNFDVDAFISPPASPRSPPAAAQVTPCGGSMHTHDDTAEAELILREATQGDSGIFSSPEASTAALTDEDEHERRLRARHPKPDEPYMTLIAKAIISSPENKIVLADIYRYIIDSSPYFSFTKSSWKNSVRHNLSVNECFVKCGRARNGRGFYWTVHPACLQIFKDGDFTRRVARAAVQQCLRRAENAQAQAQAPFYYAPPQPAGAHTSSYPQLSSTPVRNHPYFNQSAAQLNLDPTWQNYSYPFNYSGSFS